jgi:hypothetical protein
MRNPNKTQSKQALRVDQTKRNVVPSAFIRFIHSQNCFLNSVPIRNRGSDLDLMSAWAHNHANRFDRRLVVARKRLGGIRPIGVAVGSTVRLTRQRTRLVR